MEIKDRIKQFMDLQKLDIKAFEREIGTSNGSWSGARTLSENVLLKTIARFPELSSDWLLKGKGEMFVKETSSNAIEDNNELVRLREENARLREELRMKTDPNQPKKETEVYRLWMEHMKLSEQQIELSKRMHALYQKQKEE